MKLATFVMIIVFLNVCYALPYVAIGSNSNDLPVVNMGASQVCYLDKHQSGTIYGDNFCYNNETCLSTSITNITLIISNGTFYPYSNPSNFYNSSTIPNYVLVGSSNQTYSSCHNITDSNIDLCNVPSTDLTGIQTNISNTKRYSFFLS